MALASDHAVTNVFVRELLALPTPEQRLSLLSATSLFNAEGLERLLDAAERLVRSDPGQAHRLAALCTHLADRAAAPAAIPRADYISAQTCASRGELDAALRMIEAAYEGYIACGKKLEALRTRVGRMSVLLELGLYQEALETGRTVLDTLQGWSELGEVSPTMRQSKLLVAFVHQNRGGCLEYMGHFNEALDAYAIAEGLYRTLGERERLGEILDNRGAVLLVLGRGNEALAAHRAAADVFASAGLTLSHAKALNNVGAANRQLGNYRLSLGALEQARRMYESLGALADKGSLMVDMASAYLELNLQAEALDAYQKAEALLDGTGMVHDRARALWGMGSTLIIQAEFEEAQKVLEEAARLFAAAGNAPLLSGVMLEQAALQEIGGDYESALSTAMRALELVSEQDWPVQRVYAHLRLADLLLPDAAAVESHLLKADRLAERLALPHLRYRLSERLGRLRRLQGRDGEARVLLEAAVDQIESLRGTVAHEAMRISFLSDKVATYDELLRLHLSAETEDGSHRAFVISERAKSRALVDLITGVIEEPVTTADEALTAQIRNLQSDLNATYNQLLDGANREESGATLPDLRGRTVELETEISQLLMRAPSTTVHPLASPDTRECLPNDVTLVAYHVVSEEIVAFVNSPEGTFAVRNAGTVAKVARLLQQLDVQWDRMGGARVFVGRHAALLDLATREVLASLYGELVAPLEEFLNDEVSSTFHGDGAPRKLAVVPHGLLHHVPFHALFDGESYLLERFEISYAPSVKIYSLCQKQLPQEFKEALVMSVADSRIPSVTEEANIVARHLPSAEVLCDQDATVEALRSRASGHSVLHLACHGVFRADNPMFSSLKLHDGWLTAADIMRLDLGGALVTLSACESGRNAVLPGDELIGLTRGVLGAGAATLVGSLWLVQDETTAWLMGRLYEQLHIGIERATALRDAQLELKAKFPHPYYWAPFVLIGRR
jgi:tetratricopeptide (TPR) repeat protein